jgi:hypothetical protein
MVGRQASASAQAAACGSADAASWCKHWRLQNNDHAVCLLLTSTGGAARQLLLQAG